MSQLFKEGKTKPPSIQWKGALVDPRCFERNTRPKRSCARRFGRAPLLLFLFLYVPVLALSCTTSSAWVLLYSPVLPVFRPVLPSATGTGIACCCNLYWYWKAVALCGRPEACPRGVHRGTPVLDVCIGYSSSSVLDERPVISLYVFVYGF